MLDEAWVGVLVVPVSWVSQGGLEHVCLMPSPVAFVGNPCDSQGGLEQMGEVTPPDALSDLEELCTVPVRLEPMLERAVVCV